jgi:hypothetical protein
MKGRDSVRDDADEEGVNISGEKKFEVPKGAKEEDDDDASEADEEEKEPPQRSVFAAVE